MCVDGSKTEKKKREKNINNGKENARQDQMRPDRDEPHQSTVTMRVPLITVCCHLGNQLIPPRHPGWFFFFKSYKLHALLD